jgi:hypothetical protein
LNRYERSAIVDQAEDGVILTKTTRNRRMTRRHSLSRAMEEAPRRNSGNGSICSLEKPSRRNSGNGSTCSQTSPTQAEATHIPLGRRGVDVFRSLFTGMGNSQSSRNLKVQPKKRSRRASMSSTPALSQQGDPASTGTTSSTPVLTQSQQVQPKKRSRRASMSSTPALSQQGDPMNVSRRGSPRDTSFGRTDSLRDWGSSTHSTHSTARRGKSDSISGSFHRSRTQCESSLADLMVDCNTIISVSNTWSSVRGLPDYQKRFGEQCILRFLEANPQARKQMRLESFFTPRFTTLCKVIFEVVDFVTTLLGPELEEASEELSELGQRCRDEGINTLQLGDAVSSAVAVLLGDDVTPDMTKAWKVTFDSLASRMSVVSNNC